jgi:hypothetical protein
LARDVQHESIEADILDSLGYIAHHAGRRHARRTRAAPSRRPRNRRGGVGRPSQRH